MAGHSKWANIKHRKARQDAKRGKIYTKLIRELTVAAKQGDEPNDNPRLRLALERANSENMPKDTIKRAIERGAGKGEASNLEEVIYEGYGPGGVAILIEAMTDNRNRTVAEVRHAFTKYGGNLGTDGSVAYIFKKIGEIYVSSDSDEEKLFEAVIENGGDDVEKNDESFRITSSPADFEKLLNALKKDNFSIINAELSMKPDNTIDLDHETAEKLLKILDFIDEIEDVQEVYSNGGFPDDFKID